MSAEDSGDEGGVRDSMSMKVKTDKGWMHQQEKVFSNWINMKLKSGGKPEEFMIKNLYDDLKDGWTFFHLFEVLSGQSLKPLGKLSKGKMKVQHMSNMAIIFKYIDQTVKTVGIGPQDIVEENHTLVLGLLWSIIVFFMVKDLGGIEDLTALKKKVVKWVKKKCAGYDDCDIDNLTSSFASGKPFMAILNNMNPAGFPYDPTDDPLENVKKAFKYAEEEYGVPCLIDTEDPDFWKDEKGMLTQLATMMGKLPDHVDQPKDVVDQWCEEHVPQYIKDLSELASIPSIPEDPNHVSDVDSAAQKVQDMMKDAGLNNVWTDSDDGGAPFVVGDNGTDENKPTVLIYSNYTVSDPDDCAAGTWDGNPFDVVQDSGEGNNPNLKAKGVAEDKAHVVAPIAAVKAIMDTLGEGDLPVNVKVVVGGVPPPTHKLYDPSNNTQKLKGFCDRNKDKLAPDYVLVSEPDGSLLVPGAAAGMFSCRGFVSFDASASTFASGTNGAFCSRWVGPCLDPAMALLGACGTLRTDEGQIAVDGMDFFPMNEKIENSVKNIVYSEDDLRGASNYLPNVALAPAEEKTLVEQLCFGPGVSLVVMGGSQGTLPEATVPEVSTIRVHANLPPTQPVADAYEKLTAHISGAMPHGVKVEFSNMKGEPGWCSDPEHEFYQATCTSMKTEFAPKPATSLGNPEYKPIPATFANVFGKPTYMHGVNDPSRNVGDANENVQASDVEKEIKAFIRTLAGIGKLPLGPAFGQVAVYE